MTYAEYKHVFDIIAQTKKNDKAYIQNVCKHCSLTYKQNVKSEAYLH